MTDDKQELEKKVAEVVKDLFNEKEEAEIRRKTEVELQKAATTISELTSALEGKNEEVAEYLQKISDIDTVVKSLETELEAAKKELELAGVKVSEAETKLTDMIKDRAAESRIAELEGAGVNTSDKASQTSKVRSMTDEEFVSYKEELVSIRQSVIAELEKAREKADAEASAKAEEDARMAAEAAKNSQNTDTEDTTIVTPAQIPDTAKASLNLENDSVKDIVSKYNELGKELASKWSKKSN